tara:strand:+ start:109 stop:546 length:438 start_codon:yes stop_codon:yes gene_type:complete
MGRTKIRHKPLQSAVRSLLRLTAFHEAVFAANSTGNTTAQNITTAHNTTTQNQTINIVERREVEGNGAAQQPFRNNVTAVMTQGIERGLSDGGKEALILLCLGVVFISIITIAAHYCGFRDKQEYKQLVRENELVEIDVYEDDEP